MSVTLTTLDSSSEVNFVRTLPYLEGEPQMISTINCRLISTPPCSRLSGVAVLIFATSLSAQMASPDDMARVANPQQETKSGAPVLVVLGNVQDGGFPHIGCRRPCCARAWGDLCRRQLVTSLGLFDPLTRQSWLFEASPDFPEQLSRLSRLVEDEDLEGLRDKPPSGIFVTHAHIGHYTGLMYLGREAMGAQNIPTYVMPRMRRFLCNNGPWSQLVNLKNVDLRPLEADTKVALNERLTVTPFLVPHRDEYSETVGFIVRGPNRSAVFLPDIDKWQRWTRNIESLIQSVDYAFLDGTFFSSDELPGRDMSEIPHPLIEESLARFKQLNELDRRKIYFIHMNHTNPALRVDSLETRQIIDSGSHVARIGNQFPL